MRTAVVIPWRDKGDKRRRLNMEYVVNDLDGRGWLDEDRTFSQVWPNVYTDGRTGDAPFNRQAAYNLGVKANPGAEVFVFHEADMIVPDEQLRAACVAAYDSPGLVVPFSHYAYLTANDSLDVLQGGDHATKAPQYVQVGSMGAVNVVSAETMRLVGQWDELLSGHGYDDNAMFEAFRVAAGPARFVRGVGWHLWHPGAYSPWFGDDPNAFPAAEVEATQANAARWELYQQATTPERVRELTAGGV